MARHIADPFGIPVTDDYTERLALNEALDALVDAAEWEADTQRTPWQARHSNGEIDHDAELAALVDWFGIE